MNTMNDVLHRLLALSFGVLWAAAAVEKPRKLEKIGLEALNHQSLSVVQSRDVANESAAAHSVGDEAVFHNDDSGTVFRPDLFVEDFYAKDAVRRHKDITKLYLSLSAPHTAVPHGANRSVENFYSKSIRNLKRAAPDLRSIQLRGGYRFYPKQGTPEMFASEMRRLRKAVETVAFGAKNAGIKDVQFDPLRVELVHEKNLQRPVQTLVLQALMDTFDVRKLELDERHTLHAAYNLDGRACQLRITFVAAFREGYSRDLELVGAADTFGGNSN